MEEITSDGRVSTQHLCCRLFFYLVSSREDVVYDGQIVQKINDHAYVFPQN